MNRRKFLQLFSTALVSLTISKLVIAKQQISSVFAPYKDRTVMEAGYFYCPYIPLQTTSVYDGEKVQFKTRYNAPVAQLE